MWFGYDAPTLEQALSLPRVVAESSLSSTMDAAHALAADGAPAGTLVLAEEQHAGRGRGGNRWRSAPRAGIWLTLIERPADAAGLEVLSLRVGLRVAPVLERWTTGPVRLKWPNDLYVHDAKLAGVLIEARWRDQRPDWVAIGIGVNLVESLGDLPTAALQHAVALDVVGELVPALRAAAFARGALTEHELAQFAERDLTHGRRVSSPGVGTACGITAEGELLVESSVGLTSFRSGSLVLS
jgi:BirA family transcriptional regulator, biotin operon repressor / biotin---[acetyl-CoA-carboxylase] ligase